MMLTFIFSIAWLIGWSLILEYTIGSAAVARGTTPNLVFYYFSFWLSALLGFEFENLY